MLTTARLTEHHTAGGMSRQLPYLSELQPELFVEVSPELAAERGLTHWAWCHVVTSRAAVQARAVVTDRMRAAAGAGPRGAPGVDAVPLGQRGLVTGDVVNDLLGVVADPNVFIQESKVATCDVRPGPRAARGHGAAWTYVGADYRRRAGDTRRSVRRGPTSAAIRIRCDDVAGRRAGTPDHPPRVGFFTDTSVCIGCKACEVACKQWNAVPDDEPSTCWACRYDNTGALGANAWRHVAFIEQPRSRRWIRRP